jgi:peroxiredoxin
METLDFNEGQLPSRPALSPAAIAGFALLALITVLLTWRASLLEASLQRQDEQPALVDRPAPDFTVRTLDGRTVSLADFRGQKNIVVAFWASWCGPCRLEMPVLIEFYKKNHSDASDFEILAVSIDEDTKEAENFAAAQKLNFPVLLDPAQKMANAYEVEGIPTMFVIGKNGRILFGHSGYSAGLQFQLASELGIKNQN